ncbi:MAG: cytochrome P450 [Kutzneria sp.]|nr:cytochrome P450 [Kutzneria sp.]
MTPTTTPLQALPVDRAGPFDPSARFDELREHSPISRLRFSDGHLGWLVTDHATARHVLASPLFSSRAELRHAVIKRPVQERFSTPQPGMFIAMDPPDHSQYRRLLTGQFTVRRMKQLEPRIAQIVQDHLDAMLAAGPPADLVRSFALPIPSLVICELLGVPYAERDRFQHDTAKMVSLNTPRQDAEAAADSIQHFMEEMVALKHREPDDAIISGLIATGELTDTELTNISMLLLVAGHETTANMLALGTFALLSNPDQVAALRAEPTLIPGAVEELLRYLTIIQFGLVRTALTDVEVGGQQIKAGESVCLFLPSVNRDPAAFGDTPDTLDVHRITNHHLAFGHGVHQCLGQQLARVEMRMGYAALLRGLPGLRLAVDPSQVPMREDMSIYGVHELPITWDVD